MNDLLDDIMGYALDEEQRAVVYSKEDRVLVVAGAGSGKSLTIIGKIHYLIQHEKMNTQDILCISFTRASASSLKEKLFNYYHYELDVYTFHKLALEIVKENSSNPITIARSDLLEYAIREYFYGIVLENDFAMRQILRYFKVKVKGDVSCTYQKFITSSSREFLSFQTLLAKFIKLFKGQGYKKEKFYEYFLQNRNRYWFAKHFRNALFLKIAWDIYLFYEEELRSSNTVDFDDMILRATEMASTLFSKNYKYVIIDEYQDTSYTRFLLIQEILKQTGAKLLVVGDDFQSIYQFTGCNLDMFLDFQKFFPEASIYKITHTYRNSQELIDMAGKFIMRNPRQIQKNLKSSKSLENPIELYYTSHAKNVLLKLLDKLSQSSSILILGRNNQDIVPFLDEHMVMDCHGVITYDRFPELSIQYLTIHKSKGLEADQVILIHVVEDIMGIPSQMVDDPVLKFVLDKKEQYPFEEERRLFYVALTRTKNKVYILSNKSCPSRFLKEFQYDLKNVTYNEL